MNVSDGVQFHELLHIRIEDWLLFLLFVISILTNMTLLCKATTFYFMSLQFKGFCR